MKFSKKLRSNSGFTLAEMLVVVAIIIILLGVSIPALYNAAINYKMTELNATARQIFIATQNNLTNLKVRGIDNTIDGKGISWVDPTTGSTRQGTYMNNSSADIKLILPENSIDGEVADNEYTILYNSDSDTVIEVFYGENPFDSENALTNLSGRDDAIVDARRDERLGYYNGDDLENAPTLKLDAPTITITNDDRLTVDISAMDVTGSGKDTRLIVTVESFTDPSKSVEFYEDVDFNGRNVGSPTMATLVLDSLFPGENKFGTLVGNKLSDFPFSEQINVFARIEYIGTAHVAIPEYSNVVESNGLYESKESDEAMIGYPRHLQNLDSDRNPTNGAAPFTAVQTKLINWYGEKNATPVSFEPINPKGLINGYDGKNLIIRDIWIDKATAESPEKVAGLFGELSGTSSEKIRLSDIRLVNPSMEAENFTTVGSLIGSASHVNINRSFVYIIDHADGKAHERYKLVGKTLVGGMIGQAADVNIQNSFSGLAYVQGIGNSPVVGGFIAQTLAGNVNINNSYAVVDTLIAHKNNSGTAAMFVADNKVGNNLKVNYSYAVGNIHGVLKGSKPSTINGFFNTGTANNSYCAVSYLDSNGEKLGLTNIGGFASGGNLTNAMYLNPIGATVSSSSKGTAKSYTELGDLRNNGSFIGLNKAQSKPYRKELIDAKEAFPFAGLKTTDNAPMPHYGSWPEKDDLKDIKLTYYEQYSDDSIGVHFYNSSKAKVANLKGNAATISKTGYGIIIPSDQVDPDIDKMEIQYKTKTGFQKLTAPLDTSPSAMKTVTINKVEYTIKPFTQSAESTITTGIVTGNTPSFRQALIQILNLEGAVSGEANVHPALGAAVSPIDKDLGTETHSYQVRTPKQLTKIDIPSGSSEHYIFKQTHNIDAKSSAGSTWNSKTFVNRTLTSPYKTSDTSGEINNITNLNAPLFELIEGKSSKIEGINLVKSNIKITNDLKSAGIFANSFASGTINECTVQDSAITSKVKQFIATNSVGYVAGFISYSGINDSTALVSNCDVINVSVEATNNGTAAGFVATNGAKIDRCQVYSQDTSTTPVGPGSYDKVNINSTGFAAGFAANLTNSSNLSYCSVTGTVTGKLQALGFVQQPGSSIITNSYANCNVKGGTACGFTKDATSATIKNCYAMLNVEGTSYSAGFAERVNPKVENCFTTSTVISKNWNNAFGFAQTGKPTNSYYIGQNFLGIQQGIASSVDEMVTPAFITKLKGDSWVYDEDSKPSFPYIKILQKKINPFPMIKDFNHYGDWLIVPEVPAGLVYYETYKGLNQEMPLYTPDGEAILDPSGNPVTEIRPIYYVYGIDSSGITTSNLKGNEYTITDAGYGVLLPTGSFAQSVKIEYGDGGTDYTTINNTLKEPLQTGVAVQTAGGNVHVLRRFTRASTITLGHTIDQMDTHLSVPIKITYGKEVRAYDMAPFSAQGVAPLDLTKKSERVKFGTNQVLEYVDADGNIIKDVANAKVRTARQLDDIDRYIGLKPDKVSPTRYFLQTHNVEMKVDRDIEGEGIKRDKEDIDQSVILGINATSMAEKAQAFANAEYNGDNNSILNSDQTFAEIIFGTGVVKNLVIDNAEITEKDNQAIFANRFSGTIENCHVINSTLENKKRTNLAGFIGDGNTMSGNEDGENITYYPKLSNSSVKNTTIENKQNKQNHFASGFAISYQGGAISNSYVEDVTVKAFSSAGFIISNKSRSMNSPSGTIENSYASGNIISTGTMNAMSNIYPYAAGFAYENGGVIDKCYTTNVNVEAPLASGFSIHSTTGSIISNSYSNGVVNCIGNGPSQYSPVVSAGFALKMTEDSKIENCYSSVVLDGKKATGTIWLFGFLGDDGGYAGSNGTVENCYSVSTAQYNPGSVTLFGFSGNKPSHTATNTEIKNCYYLKTFNKGSGTYNPAQTKGTAMEYATMKVANMKLPTGIWQNGPGGTEYPFPIITAIGSHTGTWPKN